MASTIVEKHYVIAGEKNTKNMRGVLEEIPRAKYYRMINRIKIFEKSPAERCLGSVTDKTTYYFFEGNNILLENGLVQTGTAKTTDNMKTGFKMTRLFANSLEELSVLEMECGLI